MAKKLLTGNEAIAQGAYEADVSVATGYPGTPSTEILENVSKLYGDIYCEWSPNEKVAFEAAVGASTTGARAMTTMKLVGLNVAADPLMTLSYTGVNGGFIAVVADDPGMNSSQDEQDTRLFAHFAKVPVLEPSDSQEAKDFMKAGFELSEQFNTPVILRTTTTVSHSRGVVETADRVKLDRPHSFKKDPQRYVPIPAFARGMRVRLEERVEKLSEALEENRYKDALQQMARRDFMDIIDTLEKQYNEENEISDDTDTTKRKALEITLSGSLVTEEEKSAQEAASSSKKSGKSGSRQPETIKVTLGYLKAFETKTMVVTAADGTRITAYRPAYVDELERTVIGQYGSDQYGYGTYVLADGTALSSVQYVAPLNP